MTRNISLEEVFAGVPGVNEHRDKLIPSEHFNKNELGYYLIHKGQMTTKQVGKVKDHLNNCLGCWGIWNKIRWDAARETAGYKELRKYLGNSFEEYFDSSWAIASDWFADDPKTDDEIADFYKNTHHYLYNLVIWHESGDRDNFSKDVDNLRKRFGVSSAIDYGCGVGNDGLMFLEHGLEVDFVDFKCPSVDFLNWRVKRRKLKAQVVDVETINKLPVSDMFWAIDVLEHMTHPLWVVEHLSNETKVFVHRSEFGRDHGGRHPCHLDFNELNLNEALRRRGFRHIPWPVLSVWVKK